MCVFIYFMNELKHVCICVFIYFMNECKHVCMFCMYICVYIYMYVRMNSCMYIYTLAHYLNSYCVHHRRIFPLKRLCWMVCPDNPAQPQG